MNPDPKKIPIRATTQEHLDIETIQDDIVILKDGSCCLVLEVAAVNFGLLSETEQDAIIYAYAGLLNSLSFPIQIVIRSHQKDISSYIKLLSRQEKKEGSPKIKEQIKKYRRFVESVVKENEVLDKKFYVVVPFSSLSLGFKSAFGPKKTNKLPLPKEEILEKAKNSLYPKRDHLFAQFGRLGLKIRQLTTQQLIELFYNIYNPEVKGQSLTPPKDYQTYFVKPAVEKSTGAAANKQPAKNIPTGNSPASKPPVNRQSPAGDNQRPLEGQALQHHIEQVVQRVKNQNEK